VDVSAELDALWARGGLEGLPDAATLRATITARTLLADASATRAAATTLASVAGHLSPELAGTLPTLPSLDLVAGGAPSAERDRAEFTVAGVLGEGGMGRVLVARQRSLARDVAVKVRRPEAPIEAGAALLSEARIMGHLEHPSIVPVHALGRDADGSPVIVMKRIEGELWSALLSDADHAAWAKLATLSPDRRTAHVEILVAVCSAVEFAHSRGVIHRDLKPDNVMVGAFGEVYVTDWGIALPLAGVPKDEPARYAIVGTPVYMAPEMVTGDPRKVDARTDVFLLGAVLHEILTGAPRHAGRALRDVLLAALEPAPFAYPETVPEELAAIANRATAASPDERFPDVASLQRALVAYLHHRGSIALSDAASRSLANLVAAVAIPPAERGADADADVERLGTECRFGFLQALRAWPENAVAAAGHAQCLATLVEDQVARGDAHGARALLREIEAPPPELGPKVEALERALERRARELAALERRAHEMDPTVGGAERTRMLIVGLGGTLIVTALIVSHISREEGVITAWQLAWIPLVTWVPFGILVALVAGSARGRFLATEFNRRAARIVVVGLVMITLHRVVAALANDPVLSVLRGDAAILAGVFLTAGVAQHPLLALAAIPLLVAAVILPESAARGELVFGLGVAVAMAIGVVGSALMTKRPERETDSVSTPRRGRGGRSGSPR
jgi:serine/threonine-protein kinase